MTGQDRRGVAPVGLTGADRQATPSGADVAVRVRAPWRPWPVSPGGRHLHTVAMVTEHGEDTATAQLVPVTPDGLIVAAGLVLLHSARSHRSAPPLARLLLGVGIAVTLAVNALHGLGHGPVGARAGGAPVAGDAVAVRGRPSG